MCGIVGIWNSDCRAIDLEALERATTSLRHRGPDDEGYLRVNRGEESLQRLTACGRLCWDAAPKTLFASRDRFGEKPLHYIYAPGKMFAFASEMKSFWASGIAGRNVHQDTLDLYTQYGSLDVGEQTLYQNILLLPQAHALKLTQNGVLQKWRYWDIDPRKSHESPTSYP